MPLNNDQPVFFGDHEFENLLGAWGKGDTPANRGLLTAEAKKFSGDPDWKPHTWERFYQYAEAKRVKSLLADNAGTLKRTDEFSASGYTVVDGWGPPRPKMPAPLERKIEPAPPAEPKIQPAAKPSTFIFVPEPAPQASKPKEPTTVFSEAIKPAPLPPGKEFAPPPDKPAAKPFAPETPAPVLREEKQAPKPAAPSPPPPGKETVPSSFDSAQPPEKPMTIAQGPSPAAPPETGTRQPPVFTRSEAGATVTTGEELPAKRRSGLVPLLLVIMGLTVATVIVLVLFFTRPRAESAISSPSPAATPSPTASTAVESPEVAPAERFTRAVADNTPVMFIGDQEFFLPGEERKLDNILAAAEGLSNADLLVTGHTADNAMPHPQFVLSLERAQTVRDYLLKSPSGSVFRIQVRGRGALEPVIEGVPLSEQAANRRVEIKVKSAE